jgi:hypothetical protein
MEVFSVFSSDKSLIEKLIESFLRYKNTKVDAKDKDTLYLKFEGDESSRIYLHFETSFEEELKSNFEQEEELFIKRFFKDRVIFMVDISYNNPTLLYQLLSDYTNYLDIQIEETPHSLLFWDPFEGFVEINDVGSKIGR